MWIYFCSLLTSRLYFKKATDLWGVVKNWFSSAQFSRSLVSDSLRSHEPQHARPPCPSSTPGVHSDSCPSSQWCHPAISSSVGPLLLLPPILPSIRVFFNESTLHIGEGNGNPLQYSCLENKWMEEPGRLQSMGSLRVRHHWATSLSLFTFMHWRRKWQPTPVFLPTESQGWGGLVGCHLWGRTESDTTEAT